MTPAPVDWDEMDRLRAAFHAHLDVCRHCDENPFDLCPTGDMLMRRALQRPPKLVDTLRLVPED